MALFSGRFWAKAPRQPETVQEETCYIYRGMLRSVLKESSAIRTLSPLPPKKRQKKKVGKIGKG